MVIFIGLMKNDASIWQITLSFAFCIERVLCSFLGRDKMDAGGLRLLKVLHRASGVCVFSRRWKWHPHAHEEGVDALVLSFTQFAREIDGGSASYRVVHDSTRLVMLMN